MKGIAAVILAAGRGKRMRSKKAKVLHHVAGRPILSYPLEVTEALSGTIVVVVGHQAESVKGSLKDKAKIKIVMQEQLLGTGDAVKQTKDALADFDGDILILNGDLPLIRIMTIRNVIRAHRQTGSPVTLVTAIMENPAGYGRISRDRNNRLIKIIEETDASEQEKGIREINAGIYLIRKDILFWALGRIGSDNRQGEHYLTDIIGVISRKGEEINTVSVSDPEEVIGINRRADLARSESIMRRRIADLHMQNGVTLIDPANTSIDHEVKIGIDSIIYPYSRIEGRSSIGEDCIIGPHVRIRDTVIGNGVEIKDASVITGSRIESGAVIGPFAHIRPGVLIRKGAKIGNFVEVKNSRIGTGSKANHLSYLGDAKIGNNVNIGAGTITCNYNGKKKYETTIGDGVFVGSDTQFIAPVKIGKGSFIGAGSTITEDVPPGSLALSRAKQVNKKGWVKKKRCAE